eukprot:NODE_82_length_22708_cov_0.383476.p9 type:complete len:216 gc:universal NODE_82_length_22708_cov_0.383476:11303-10656(-)
METLKILLIGNSNAGKSSILLRFTENTFTDESITTIGVDFKLKMVQYQETEIKDKELSPKVVGPVSEAQKTYKLCCFDTAGQERFSKLTSSYYRNAQGVLLVFDLSNKETFTSLDKWYKELQAYCPSVPIVVVGNKSDQKREITRQEATKYAESINATYVEVSAKTNLNINEVFQTLLGVIIPSLSKKVKRSSSLRSVRSIQFNRPSTESSYCSC